MATSPHGADKESRTRVMLRIRYHMEGLAYASRDCKKMLAVCQVKRFASWSDACMETRLVSLACTPSLLIPMWAMAAGQGDLPD